MCSGHVQLFSAMVPVAALLVNTKRRANNGKLTRSHVVRVVYSIRLIANYSYTESNEKTKVQSDLDENTQARMAVHIIPGWRRMSGDPFVPPDLGATTKARLPTERYPGGAQCTKPLTVQGDEL
jgi:hypothetical protein